MENENQFKFTGDYDAGELKGEKAYQEKSQS